MKGNATRYHLNRLKSISSNKIRFSLSLAMALPKICTILSHQKCWTTLPIDLEKILQMSRSHL